MTGRYGQGKKPQMTRETKLCQHIRWTHMLLPHARLWPHALHVVWGHGGALLDGIRAAGRRGAHACHVGQCGHAGRPLLVHGTLVEQVPQLRRRRPAPRVAPPGHRVRVAPHRVRGRPHPRRHPVHAHLPLLGKLCRGGGANRDRRGDVLISFTADTHTPRRHCTYRRGNMHS